MRIICDNCSRPIAGTVQRLAGNFNLHPDCLAQLEKEANHGSTADPRFSKESSRGTSVEWRGSVPGISRELDSL